MLSFPREDEGRPLDLTHEMLHADITKQKPWHPVVPALCCLWRDSNQAGAAHRAEWAIGLSGHCFPLLGEMGTHLAQQPRASAFNTAPLPALLAVSQ